MHEAQAEWCLRAAPSPDPEPFEDAFDLPGEAPAAADATPPPPAPSPPTATPAIAAATTGPRPRDVGPPASPLGDLGGCSTRGGPRVTRGRGPTAKPPRRTACSSHGLFGMSLRRMPTRLPQQTGPLRTRHRQTQRPRRAQDHPPTSQRSPLRHQMRPLQGGHYLERGSAARRAGLRADRQPPGPQDSLRPLRLRDDQHRVPRVSGHP